MSHFNIHIFTKSDVFNILLINVEKCFYNLALLFFQMREAVSSFVALISHILNQFPLVKKSQN